MTIFGFNYIVEGDKSSTIALPGDNTPTVVVGSPATEEARMDQNEAEIKPIVLPMVTTKTEKGLLHSVYINAFIGDFFPLMFACELATENDIIHIDIADCSSLTESAAMNLLSSILTTKAHVRTRASLVSSIGALALWLGGKEPQYSRTMLIQIKDDIIAPMGPEAAIMNNLQYTAGMRNRLFGLIQKREFLKPEEIEALTQKRAVITITGVDVVERAVNMKPL